MTRRTVHWQVLLLVVLAVGNLQLFSARIDTTRSRLHSLSDASMRIVSELPNELLITYAVSDRLRTRFSEPDVIVDLLRSYEAASRGNMTVRIVDPVVSGRTAEFEERGIVPQQLEVVEEGEQTLALVYSGIVLEYLDRTEVLPFVFSSGTLEYEITSAIRSLEDGGAGRVVLVDGRAGGDAIDGRALFASRLATGYAPVSARPGEPIADDTGAVVVLHAEDLAERDVEVLGDYLDRGGAVLLGVDAVGVDIARGLIAEPILGAPVRELARRFGLSIGNELLLDESSERIPVEEISAGLRVTRLYDYPHWVSLDRRYTSAEHPVTAQFPGLTLYWPTTVVPADTASQRAETIVASTPRAWTMGEPYVTNPQDTGGLVRDRERTEGQYGVVATAVEQETGARLVVVADGDFLDDALLRTSGASANLEFAMGLVQWLAADEDLLQIRSRATFSSRLNVESGVLSPGAVTVLNIAIVPGAIVVVGLVRVRRRNRRGRG